VPAWAAPVAAALTALATGVAGRSHVRHAWAGLGAPLAFLVLAVPLAAMLDEVGVFEALADVAATRAVRLELTLWVVAAVVVAVLDLDAAVVLLTPLYVRVARRTGCDPIGLAAAPALLACLASMALPVSNLTNLAAVARTGVAPTAFLSWLGLPTSAGCAVGYVAWRRAVLGPRSSSPAAAEPDSTGPRTPRGRALRIGGVVGLVLVVGFVGGPQVGVEPWVVAAVVDLALLAVLRRVPWRSVPVGPAALAYALAALAPGVAEGLDLGHVLHATGAGGAAVAAGVGAGGAALVNNLPALLLGVDALRGATDARLWGLLLGVDLGPLLLVTASLSGLLWLESLRAEGQRATAWTYTRIGVLAGLPGALAALAALLVEVALR
jgi:arsenical pump membrane protein